MFLVPGQTVSELGIAALNGTRSTPRGSSHVHFVAFLSGEETNILSYSRMKILRYDPSDCDCAVVCWIVRACLKNPHNEQAHYGFGCI